MPRPAAQRARGKSTSAKFLSDAAQLVAAVSLSRTGQQQSLLDNQQVQTAIFTYCSSLQQLFPQDAPYPADKATEVVIHVTDIDLLHTMLTLLRAITPSSLLESPGCSDPACGDQACGPPEIAPVLLMAFNMTTNLIISCDDTDAQDNAYRKLVDSQLASSLVDLTEVAASLLRANPRDLAAIAGADHALATCLDTLQHLIMWTQAGGQEDEDADSSTHCCVVLAKQLEALGFMPRACALNEALTLALVATEPQGRQSLRTRGTDAPIMRLVQVWCMLDQVHPKTGISVLDTPVLYDSTFRMAARAALKLGAKLPASVVSAAAGPIAPGGLPRVQELRPHWQVATACRSILLEAIRSGCALLQVGVPGVAGSSLVSLPMAQTALAVVRLAAGSKSEAASVQGDACAGCVLMNLAMQACALGSDVALLLPRSQAGLLAEDATGLLVVMQVKAMGRSRTVPVAGAPVDDCNSGEVDWALADAMLGLLLYTTGGMPSVLRGRVQRTAGLGGRMHGGPQSLLAHSQLHCAQHATILSGAAPGSPSEASAAYAMLPSKRLLRCVEGLLRVPAPLPQQPQQQPDGAPLEDGVDTAPPPPPRPAVRAAHLGCLDLATVLYSAPEGWIGTDLVSLCATVRKTCSGLLEPQLMSLHPDSAAELVMKLCHLLLETLSTRQGVLPPGQREAFGAASLHVLSACQQLLTHLSAHATAGNASAAALAEGPFGVTNRKQAQALAECSCCCAAVAAECVGQVSQLCFALVKAGEGAAVAASGAQHAVGVLLDGLVTHRTRGRRRLMAAAQQVSAGGVEAPGAAVEADPPGSYFRDCKTGKPSEADASLRRALVWTSALALLQVLVGLCSGTGGQLQAAEEVGEPRQILILSSRVIDSCEVLAPGSLSISSALAGAAFVEYQAKSPIASILPTTLADLEEQGQAAAVHPVDGAEAAAAAGCSSGAGGDGAVALKTQLDQWAHLHIARRKMEKAGGKGSTAEEQHRIATEYAAALSTAKAALLSACTIALPTVLSSHLLALAVPQLPKGIAVAVESSDESFATSLMQLAMLVQDAAAVALQAALSDSTPAMAAAVALCKKQDADQADAAIEATEDLAVAVSGLPAAEIVSEPDEDVDSCAASRRLLLAEGAPSGLLGGMVLAAVRAAKLAAGPGSDAQDLGADALAENLSAATVGLSGLMLSKSCKTVDGPLVLLQELSDLAQMGRRRAGDMSVETVEQLSIVRESKSAALLEAWASRGCFVGCCDPGCANMDKMSESGLELKPRGDRPGVFCSDSCAERVRQL